MLNITDDTICAISTPAGVGGIAVARISGPDAINITAKIWQGKDPMTFASHTAHLGNIIDSQGNMLDQAVITVFRAPASFTGENVVEISVHGSRYVQQELINTLVNAGARVALPGEFTRRAFANGRLDLAQAEGVADIIASTNRAAHRIAVNQMRGMFSQRLASLRSQLLDLASLLELELDFSEEEVEFASRTHLLALAQAINGEVQRLQRSFATGSAIKDGIPVAIVGATNVGKSSLLNALLDDDRAIVSDIHGTTRDLVEDTTTIGDYLFRFIDTAGLRNTTDTIEEMGIQRSRRAIAAAHTILLVLDASASTLNIDAIAQATATAAENTETKLIVVTNKIDIGDPSTALVLYKQYVEQHHPQLVPRLTTVNVSAAQGIGIDTLRTALVQAVETDSNDMADVIVTNARHIEALNRAQESTQRVIDGLHANISGDFIAQDVRQTIHHLAEITGGEITTPDILSTIFSRFCIGK